MKDKITIERIDRALDKVADAIVRFGDVYMPVYLRLEREREILVDQTSDMDRVRRRHADRQRQVTTRSIRA